ncbi:MAG: ABC transporter permease [Candidatus Methanosuratincola petrocarbonis]|nr:ABC transporter permease [Candidatus Methanosuratincola sp.]
MTEGATPKVIAVVEKELIQLTRDPRSLVMIALLPLVVMLLFGIGYGGSAGKVGIVIVDMDGGQMGSALVSAISETPTVSVKANAHSIEEARMIVSKGVAPAALVIPEGFTSSLLSGSPVQVLVIIDESSPTLASTVKDSMLAVTYYFQQEFARQVHGPSVELIYNSVYGPTVTNLEAFTPFVIALVLQLVPTTLISIAICREKEKGTFEQLIMSPVGRLDIIFGKLAAYFIATIADMLITLFVAINVFGVVIRGSIFDLLLISTVYLLGSLGLGMLISVLSRNQLQANQAAIFIFIPFLLFCGGLAPVELLSPQAAAIANVNPMYHFIMAFRSIMIKGYGIPQLLQPVAALLVYMGAMMSIAPAILKLRVE